MGTLRHGSIRLLTRQLMLFALWLAVALPSAAGISADLARDPALKITLASLCQAYASPVDAEDETPTRPQCVFCLSGAGPVALLPVAEPPVPVPPQAVRVTILRPVQARLHGLSVVRPRNRGPPHPLA